MEKLLKYKLTLLFVSLVLLGLSFALPQKVSADYDSGRLIDDVVFLNSTAMNQQGIQNFLISKGSGLAGMSFLFDCPIAGATAAQYYQSAGAPCGQVVPASTIIYYASQVYGINPQVILATLQKEQGSITDPTLSSWQINQAMGYGCPDSGSCNGGSSFFYQIDNGTWTLRYHMERARGNMDYWYHSTSWVCGKATRYYAPSLYPGQNVNFYDDSATLYRTQWITNAATSSLYCYTPHAYNNPQGLYGLPAYGTVGQYYSGSYNFVYWFENWFGPTTGTPFFKLPNQVSTYMLGSNNTYYSIRDYRRLQDYGFETVFGLRVQIVSDSYLNSRTYMGDLPPIARFEGAGVYIPQRGTIYPFSSEAMFHDYGYSFGQEAMLPKWVGDVMRQGAPVSNIARSSDSPVIYLVSGGVKRAFCNWGAYTQLGSPAFSTLPYTPLGSFYMDTIPSGGPMAVEGDVINSSDTYNQRGVWQNSAYYPISAVASGLYGPGTCSDIAANISKLPSSGTVLGQLVRSSTTNATYILDSDSRLLVSPALAHDMGFDVSGAVTLSDTTLSRLPTDTFSSAVQVKDSPAVYILRNGKRYGVASQDDLVGLGYSFSDVRVISQQTLNMFSDGGLIFKPGRLVREDNSYGVYMIDENFVKHPFTSESIFYNYGFDWSNVFVYGKGNANSYSTGAPMAYYIRENDNLYWLMDRGIKRRIPTSLVSSSYYNLNSSNSLTLPVSVLRNFPMSDPIGKVFRAGTNPGVFLIDAGLKDPFTSELTFLGAGYSWNDVNSFNPNYVSSLANGPAIR